MRWSKLKQRAENNLAQGFKGRVSFHTTVVAKGHWLGNIHIDGKPFLTLSCCAKREESDPCFEYDTLANPPGDGRSLGDLLFTQLHASIEELLNSSHPILRGLALWDHRFGKRRLASYDYDHAHEIEQAFYVWRCEIEGVKHPLSGKPLPNLSGKPYIASKS